MKEDLKTLALLLLGAQIDAQRKKVHYMRGFEFDIEMQRLARIEAVYLDSLIETSKHINALPNTL